jgi:thiamine transport system permease protein
MAGRYTVTATIASALVFGAVLAGLLPLVIYAAGEGGNIKLDSYVWSTLRFTLLQAALSTLISVVAAIPVSRALARRDFPGKHALLALFAVPLSLPVIVAVLGITQIYGNAGWFGGMFNIYGLTGILIAHVFFNMPLATRILYDAHQSIPAEMHRLAAQLNLQGMSFFRSVEWPFLKPAITSATALVFLLCAASFIIVLTLGGGPSASTLEVAIYQSLRLDFDLSRAISLALVQVILCTLLVAMVGNAHINLTIAPLRLQSQRYDGKSPTALMSDFASIAIAAILVIPPLAAIITSGVAGFQMSPLLPIALATSLALGLTAAVVTTIFAWAMARSGSRAASIVTLAGLIVPPAVIATGWFIALKNWNGGAAQALTMIIALNSLMALPFAASVLRPAIIRHAAMHDKLCDQLKLQGWKRFRIVDFPALKRPLMQAMLMAFVLSLGDLTAVTLLGTQGIITLPSLISQQMGNYRSAAAGGTALLLAAFSYILTLAAQRIGRA